MNAITARICLILKLYNAMKIMEMKHGKEWQQNKEEIESWGERSFIGGGGEKAIIYTGSYFATFTAKRYGRLIEIRTKRITTEKLKESLLRELEQELAPEEFNRLKEKLNRAIQK